MELPVHVHRIIYYLPSNKRGASPVLQDHILERKVSFEGTVAPVIMDCPVSVLYVIDVLAGALHTTMQEPDAFHLVASASLTIMESFLFMGQTVRSRELPVGCLLCQSSRLLPPIFHSVDPPTGHIQLQNRLGNVWCSSHR